MDFFKTMFGRSTKPKSKGYNIYNGAPNSPTTFANITKMTAKKERSRIYKTSKSQRKNSLAKFQTKPEKCCSALELRNLTNDSNLATNVVTAQTNLNGREAFRVCPQSIANDRPGSKNTCQTEDTNIQPQEFYFQEDWFTEAERKFEACALPSRSRKESCKYDHNQAFVASNQNTRRCASVVDSSTDRFVYNTNSCWTLISLALEDLSINDQECLLQGKRILLECSGVLRHQSVRSLTETVDSGVQISASCDSLISQHSPTQRIRPTSPINHITHIGFVQGNVHIGSNNVTHRHTDASGDWDDTFDKNIIEENTPYEPEEDIPYIDVQVED